MRYLAFLLLAFGIISCAQESTGSLPEPNEQSQLEVDTNIYEKLPPKVDTVEKVRIDTFNIVHYYNLVGPKVPLKSFEKLDYRESYAKKTFVLSDLDYKNGFMSFRTQNTPPDMDGDSETETVYELCYWVLPNGNRFLAYTSSTNTWVSEETDQIDFFLHDQNGLNKTTLNSWDWNLGDLLGSQEFRSKFDEYTWENPLVSIYLPKQGKEISVNLAFHEYMDDLETWKTFESLAIEPVSLSFNPLDDFN